MMEYSEPTETPTADAGLAGRNGWLRVAAKLDLNGPVGPFRLDVDLAFEKGAFIALAGPSGAGKTTLLRLLAGLAAPDQGLVRVGAATWCDTDTGRNVPVRRRSIGFVFQDYALFPNMTALRNVEYALGTHSRDEAMDLLALVGLEGLAGAYPARLSGGQRQRLALIRALARKPEVLMLDEPLSALDPAMRRLLQDELKRLHRDFGTTTFMVSHDTGEILRLADRIIRLEHGRVVYEGSPAGAFGGCEPISGLRLVGRHLSGPDEEGFAVVAIDGRTHRIRYMPSGVAPGDLITLDFQGPEVAALDETAIKPERSEP